LQTNNKPVRIFPAISDIRFDPCQLNIFEGGFSPLLPPPFSKNEKGGGKYFPFAFLRALRGEILVVFGGR